ncbi:MAG: hypothetical protein HC925_07570, partial [Coleofasciculaceae cyanobacterium SM2_3_26]|nr:hypothetical protein [Coleofasciculaceae cyanobacterium SM2_3_26]
MHTDVTSNLRSPMLSIDLPPPAAAPDLPIFNLPAAKTTQSAVGSLQISPPETTPLPTPNLTPLPAPQLTPIMLPEPTSLDRPE